MRKLCGRSGMIKVITVHDRIDVILSEIEYAKSKLQPHDTGNIHTAIHWMEHRLDKLRKQRDDNDPVFQEPKTFSSYDELTVESDKYW